MRAGYVVNMEVFWEDCGYKPWQVENNRGEFLGFSVFCDFYIVKWPIPVHWCQFGGGSTGLGPGGIIMICPTNAYRAVLVDIDLKKKFALIALVINHHSPRLLLQGKVAPKGPLHIEPQKL